MVTARQAALDALRAAFAVPPAPAAAETPPANPRRGFLRRLAGRRN
jgi:hypothetical protein